MFVGVSRGGYNLSTHLGTHVNQSLFLMLKIQNAVSKGQHHEMVDVVMIFLGGLQRSI